MNVEQLMTLNVESCHPGDSLTVAAHIMWDHDCGCVPVVEDDEDGTARLVGMVTDRDVCMAAYQQDRTLSEIDVGSAMATKPLRCRSTDSVASALTTMERNRVHRLPVVDRGGRLVGLLSMTDVAREAAREHAGTTKETIDCRIGEALEAITVPRGPRATE